MNLDDDVTKKEVCRADGWAVAGTVMERGVERDVPIGRYSTYLAAKTAGNMWLKSTKNPVKWTAWPCYEPVDWSKDV